MKAAEIRFIGAACADIGYRAASRGKEGGTPLQFCSDLPSERMSDRALKRVWWGSWMLFYIGS